MDIRTCLLMLFVVLVMPISNSQNVLFCKTSNLIPKFLRLQIRLTLLLQHLVRKISIPYFVITEVVMMRTFYSSEEM